MAYDPFIGPNPVLRAMETRRGFVEQVRQNTSRLAQSYNFIGSTGVGMLRLPTALAFQCSFVEKPVVSTGFTLESELLDGDFPTVTAGIWRWQIDTRGYYLGAYVFVVVTAVSEPVIQHDFCFTGIAMKDLPGHLLDL